MDYLFSIHFIALYSIYFLIALTNFIGDI